MTNGEAQRNLIYSKRWGVKPDDEALDMAIKALGQEPCDDCISRQAAKLKVARVTWDDGDSRYDFHDKCVDCLDDLPPVTPQPKMGHWIMKHRIHNEVRHYTGQDEMGETHTISVLERYEADEPYCSECGKRAGDTSQDYCCACGAKMQEVEK